MIHTAKQATQLPMTIHQYQSQLHYTQNGTSNCHAACTAGVGVVGGRGGHGHPPRTPDPIPSPEYPRAPPGQALRGPLPAMRRPLSGSPPGP